MTLNNPEFKYTIPIEKSQADSRIISGVAMGLGKDEQKQKMSQTAIQSVARQVAAGNIPFKDHHAKIDSILGSDIGTVVSAIVDEDFNLQVEVELDDVHPSAEYLYRSLNKGKQFGMSVGGTISKFHIENDNGESVVVIDDMVIDEISATTRPVFVKSFGTVVRKAIDAAETESSGETMEPEVTTTEPVESPVEVPTTNPAVEEAASAPETPVVVDSPEPVEKAVSADSARENQKLKKAVSLFAQGNAILAELGLTDLLSDSPEKPVEVEKSQPAAEDTSELTVLKSMMQEQADKHAQELEVLKSMIPSTPLPGLPRPTDELEEMRKRIESLSPSERIRFGLKMLHDGETIR
jgi:hypothetical protein